MSPFSPENSLLQKKTKPKGSLFLKQTSYITKAKEY